MKTSLQLLAQPAYEPVSHAEARGWLRLPAAASDTDANNAVALRQIIKALREDAENLTHRAYIQRSLRLNLDGYPCDDQYGWRIELPFPPVASVETFKYYDTDGVLQTLAASQYVLHNEAEPAFIIPAYQVTWPTYRALPNAIQITFTAGYMPGSPSDEASNQEVIPGSLKLWMQSKMGSMFENREQIIVGTIVAKVPRDHTDGLLDSLTIGTRIF